MSAKFVDYHSAKPVSELDMDPDIPKQRAIHSGRVCLKHSWVGIIGEEQRARTWVIDDGLLNEAELTLRPV